MLYWALVFLLIAIVAGAVGFGGVAVAFAGKLAENGETDTVRLRTRALTTYFLEST
jgi:hypothetical protein